MTSERPTVRLDAGDAAELAEMLTFIGDWLDRDRNRLETLLLNYVGNDGYGIETLLVDLARFAFLLGGDDCARLFSSDQP
jgi:hypothetical protein